MSMRASYQVDREYQRRIRQQRIRDVVLPHYERYQRMYEQLLAADANQLIPQEMEHIRGDLARIGQAIDHDPEAAQRYSFALGEYIYTMEELAASVRQEVQMKARLRLDQLRQERRTARHDALRYFEELWQQIQDPVIIELAIDDLQEIHRRIEASGEAAGNEKYKKQIKEWVDDIQARASARAEQWKQDRTARSQKQSQLTRLRDHIEQVESSITPANQEEMTAIIRQLRGLEQQVQADHVSVEAANQALAQDVEKAGEVLADEQVRLEIVRAMVKELRNMGFVLTENPARFAEGGADIVRFRAKKPSGNRVSCTVSVDGGMTWKFDEYEGQTCQKDIALFKEELDAIYGLKFTDEQVSWQNPDRISANEKPLGSDIGQQDLRGW